ncbi:MAG: PD-(D/E)XK nuclease family protein, partial [Rhodocyclaceae bacterium]
AVGQAYRKIAVEESKRVLYVSMTRARDLMIVAVPHKKPTGPWLATLDAPWLMPGIDDAVITLPNGNTIPLLTMPTCEEEDHASDSETLRWYRDPSTRQSRLPRIFNPSMAESPAMMVSESVSIGQRLAINGSVDMTAVGHAVHAALALAFTDRSKRINTADVEVILRGYHLLSHISPAAFANQVHAVSQWIGTRWPLARAFPEWPVESTLPNGQVVNGRIDLLLDIGENWILFDHKSNPGAKSDWPEIASTHGGQLLSYKQAIEVASGKPVKEIWLLLPVSAGAIRVEEANVK